MGGAVGRKNLLSRPLSASRERIAGRLIRKLHKLLILLCLSFDGRRAWGGLAGSGSTHLIVKMGLS